MARIWLPACMLSLLLLLPQPVWGATVSQVPLPARYGGTVTVGTTQITQATDSGYTFQVVKSNGLPYVPVATDLDGLNGTDWYLIDVPIYDAGAQPGGAGPGSTAYIKVYKDGNQLQITSPANGQLSVGGSGTTTQLNLTVVDVVVLDTTSTTTIAPVVSGSVTGSWGWRAVGIGLFLLLGAHFLLRTRPERDRG